MTRCALIALLLLLQAQSAWMAVAKHCGYEVAATWPHLGHFSLQCSPGLQVSMPSESDPDVESTNFPHGDCGFFQNLVFRIAAALKLHQSDQKAGAATEFTSVLYVSTVGENIERPRWMR